MPRPKTLPDKDVLEAAYKLMHRRGPEALTFSTLAQACGLSASTLVQRFKSKADLVRSTLSYAWDGLDEKTATFAARVPKTPEGAIQLLTMLSRDYGGIEAYADALLILREDLRDPALRARGAKWKAALTRALEDCFAAIPRAPKNIGTLMAAQWQGSLLWWSFDPRGRVEDYVEQSLKNFVSAILAATERGSAKKAALKVPVNSRSTSAKASRS
jgi:AcrR family transcriptional regulator